ncbi:MAG TPA: aminodeoxychorismate synthase component I, partial [Pyrinomonadaceae bacterium]
SILDSCGVGHVGSHYLIAGIRPFEVRSFSEDAAWCLAYLDETVGSEHASIFTLSYDLGRILQGINSQHIESGEPLAHIARYQSLIIHDYDTGVTMIAGDESDSRKMASILTTGSRHKSARVTSSSIRSNFSRSDYLKTIEMIKEEIRSGNTYQTNLTRRVDVDLPHSFSPSAAFARLRARHPSPFSAFICRGDSTVVSASPERFFKVKNGLISTSPIKGTRPRGSTREEDDQLRRELETCTKDRSENTMIVDLLRNDLGRICEFGSVEVTSLCEVEEHPSLFHLVSTVEGTLRENARFSDILQSLLPCGSITGAPKISTMKIIDRLERSARGLSMGAIGYYLPESFGLGERTDLSVAIRTMVIQGRRATFNVGGGIVVDSDPAKEWEETVVKSKALLDALNTETS